MGGIGTSMMHAGQSERVSFVLTERLTILAVDDDPIQREFSAVYLSAPTVECRDRRLRRSGPRPAGEAAFRPGAVRCRDAGHQRHRGRAPGCGRIAASTTCRSWSSPASRTCSRSTAHMRRRHRLHVQAGQLAAPQPPREIHAAGPPRDPPSRGLSLRKFGPPARLVRAFAGDRSAGLSVAFGLALGGFAVAAGAALDYSNASSQRYRLQSIADAAAMAGAREFRLGKRQRAGDQGLGRQPRAGGPWRSFVLDAGLQRSRHRQ